MEKVDYKKVVVDVTMYAFPIFRVKICKNIKKSEATEVYFSDWAKTIVEKCKHEDLEKYPNRYYEILVAYCDARIKEQLALKEKLMNEPQKVAKLVTFEYTTRVIVNKNEMPEVEEEDAINAGIEKVKSTILTDLCFNHCAQVVDDTECPFGTFEGEKQGKTNNDIVIDALEKMSKNKTYSKMLKEWLIELRVEAYDENEMFRQMIAHSAEEAIEYARSDNDDGYIVHCYIDGVEGDSNILDVIK